MHTWTPAPHITPEATSHPSGLLVAQRVLRQDPTGPVFATRFAIVRIENGDVVFCSAFWYSQREAMQVAEAAIDSGDPIAYFAQRYSHDSLQRTLASLNSAAPLASHIARNALTLATTILLDNAPKRTPEDEQYIAWKESGC